MTYAYGSLAGRPDGARSTTPFRQIPGDLLVFPETRLTASFNVTSHPPISVPYRSTLSGAPIELQIVRQLDDDHGGSGRGFVSLWRQSSGRSSARLDHMTAAPVSTNQDPLYPPCPTAGQTRLDVGDGHELYINWAGNPDGIPIVLVHGGPGGPWSVEERRFYDPSAYFIIGIDQRGAYRSTPLGLLRANTLHHLVADMEAVRRYLQVDRWVVQGGSFGTAVALRYAELHADRCCALILRATMLARPGFERWDFEDSRLIAPESWQAMADACPIQTSQPLAERFFTALLSADDYMVKSAMSAWYRHSSVLSGNSHRQVTFTTMEDFTPEMEIASGRLSAHYWYNQLFLPPGQILTDAPGLEGLPGLIVHGRNDRNCLPGDAHALSRVWTTARLRLIDCAGHSSFEPGIAAEIVRFSDDLRDGRIPKGKPERSGGI